MYESIWINANLATMRGGCYGAISRGALAVQDGRIAWVGPHAELEDEPERLAREVHDCEGRWVTPGLIDCHTSVVFAGHRAREFEGRLQAGREQDAAGERASRLATRLAAREASEMELIRAASARLRCLMREGVTTVEIKSGYGLDVRNELKLLRVARMLGGAPALSVSASLSCGRVLPPESAGGAESFAGLLCDEILPAVVSGGLADAVEVCCVEGGLAANHARRILEAAKSCHLPVSLYCDAGADSNGASLAAAMGALAAADLRCANEAGLKAMAAGRTVAVLLPGAALFANSVQKPAVGLMRALGVPMAIATDCNPDSAPATSLLLMLHLACTLFRLTPEEALAGVTHNAAHALGLGVRMGSLEPGKEADFALWDIEEPAQLAYAMGANPCAGVVKRGEIVSGFQ